MFARPVPMTRTPRVSVVVPCYHYGRPLPELVTTRRGRAAALDSWFRRRLADLTEQSPAPASSNP